MATSILSLLHNLKDHRGDYFTAFRLEQDDMEVLIDFLEQEDVQKCIPKVPILGRFSPSDHYLCPSCRKVLDWNNDKDNICPKCGQKIKWVEDNNEKAEHVGSKIFDNFDVTISKFPTGVRSTSEEEMDSSKEDR